MKLLIVAGGGGHFAAALAVLQQIPQDWQILVVGRKYAFENDKTLSLEYQTAKKLHIRFQPLTTGRLQRKFSGQTIPSLLRIPVGFLQALKIIYSFKPDVILSFGGYTSVPIAYAALPFTIPIVIHEQILRAGLANKIVAKFAEKICISWEQSAKFFPKGKTILTGNPIRKFSMLNSKTPIADRKLPMVYITGGSGGAHAINILVEGCIAKLLDKFIIIHQTGASRESEDYKRLIALREGLQKDLRKRYVVKKFLEPSEVFGILKRADLVIARSGINTVTELLAFQKPCLLIPLLHGQRGDQPENAKFLKEIGLAEVADQEGLTSEKLYNILIALSQNLSYYKVNEQKLRDVIKPDAALRIIHVVYDVYQQTRIAKA